MDMQCASYHSAVQRMPTFNAFVVVVVCVSIHTEKLKTTLQLSLKALEL